MKKLDENGFSFNNENQTSSPGKKQNAIKITQKCVNGNQLFQFCFNK